MKKKKKKKTRAKTTTNAHTTKEQRDEIFKREGRKITCANLYNDYKCWNNTRCCEHLKDNKKCPAFEEITGEGER